MQVVEESSYAVIYPTGYLNGPTGKDIDAQCDQIMARGMKRIIINFREIETMNTVGISTLIVILEHVGNREGVVCFCELLPVNHQMLEVLDISRAVLIFETEDQARNHLENL